MRHLLCTFLLACLAVACSEPDISRIVVDPGFGNYISAFTSGVVTSTSTIKVVLMEPHPNAKAGEIIAESVFEFEPELEGDAYWLDEQTVEFRPHSNLPSGKTFIGHFALGELLEVPDDFEDLEFGFVVISQSMFVSFAGIRAPDPKDFSQQELFGTIRTSDIADPVQLESTLKALQNDQELTIDWQHLEGGKSHRFVVKGVVRNDDDGSVELVWDGTAIGSESKDDLEIRIPPLGEFTLLQASTLREPGLHFSLQFSDPIDPSQDLTGLVYLVSGKELRLSVSGNEIKAYPTGALESEETIVVEESVVNTQGNRLDDTYTRDVEFNMELPAVELLGDGVIMPTSGGGIRFPFKAVNLKAVNLKVMRIYEDNMHQFLQANHLSGDNELKRVGRVVYDEVIDLISTEPIDYAEWNNFAIDLDDIITPEQGAIYRIMIGFERYQSLYPCAGEDGEAKPFKRSKLDEDDGDGYYYGDYDWYDEDYDWDERDDPCKPSYYMYYKRSISANLLASDLGIIAKEAMDDQYEVVVTDLRTTEPLSGIEVKAYNFQNRLIGEGATNGDGIVQLKSDGKPYLLIAEQGQQKGYLRVDNGSALSVSLFDVGGRKTKKGVKGFIYGERGVWRPGDTIFLSFMLEDQLNALPPSHPVILELFDPLGKLYDKKVSTKSVEGLYSFKLQTAVDAITGMWRAKVSVGNSEFSKSLKIETIKPNRLRIDLDAEGEVLRSNAAMSTGLTASWLYGAPGAGLRASVKMSVVNMKTTFDQLPDYQFDDRSRSFNNDEGEEVTSFTNGEGFIELFFPWSAPSNAPGMLKVKFETKVYEPGGDYSQDFSSAKYSPYSSYVGLKLSSGANWLNAMDTEESTPVSLVRVNEKGEPMEGDVLVELYDIGWNWWWEGSGGNDLTRYISRSSSQLVASTSETVDDGKMIYDLKFPEPDWGRYLLRIVDEKSGHSTSQIIYATYRGWRDNDNGGEAASMLSLETKAKSYNVGDEVEVTFPSGGIGRAFVSIEKGDQILDRFWVGAESGSTTVTFEATEEMAPNVYANVMLIQPHGQDDNSMPMRMYGVMPIEVNNPETNLEPLISCPDELQPETTFEVTVSEKAGKPMAYTLAVVDEGLLGLTRFKTPNPWSTFYAREALSIRTWDLYRYVMNAETGKMASLMAVGGDEGLEYKEDDKANRFKPVVTYLGPFYLDDGDKNTHEVKLPNYIGAVRVMVVAGYEGAYGAAEKEAQVKQPLMVLSTLPRVLGPSERVRVPVNVITMNDRVKNVKVKVETNDMLVPVNGTSQTLTFNKMGEQLAIFEFDVARKLGIAEFKVTATSGEDKAFEELELDVRPPNPDITLVEQKSLQADESWSYDYRGVGIKGTNKATLQVSRIPDLDLERHLKYLIRYPHGCIEQTTSSAFPQLFVGNLTELSDDQEDDIERNVTAALSRLRAFQLSSGGFGYWPGSNYISEWGTNYAGHFMLEAKSAGYELPEGLLSQWLKFQKSTASSWSRSGYDEFRGYHHDMTQAYRLYTLALAGEAEVGAMNRLRNDPKLTDAGAWRLSAAYALIGREDVAAELATRPMRGQKYREMSWTYGSYLRDMAMTLETLGYLEDYDRGADLLKDVCSALSTGWHSTQTRAYSLLAISKFVSAGDFEKEYNFEVTANGEQLNLDTDSPVFSMDIDPEHLSSGKVAVHNRSSNILFVSFVQSGIPVENNEIQTRDDLKMSISYKDLKGNDIDVSSLTQGTDFKALVTITHPGIRPQYDEMALSQIFPSGWQIVNTRVGEEEAVVSEKYEYQDIRDDRVYTYFDLQKGKSVTFEVLLNATFAGRYYQPSVFCAPMYDESIQALDPGQWIEVIARQNMVP